MQSSFVSPLLLLAMGQGLFLSVALLMSRQSELLLANRLLAALVLVFAAIIGHAWMDVNGMFASYPQLATSIATLPLLVGPLLWLYLHNLLHGERMSRRSALHFAPFAIALLAWAPVYLLSPPMTPRVQLPWYLAVFGMLKALHVGTYLLLAYRLIRREDRIRPDQAVVRSLRRLTLLLGVGLGLDALIFGAELIGLAMPVSSDLWGAVVLTGFVYGLAFYAVRMPIGYRLPTPAPRGKAADSLLSNVDRAQFLEKLTASMEQEQLYRDGELSLEKLASHLALTPHELSQLINQSLSVNFQEYVNSYRVRALQALLQDGANRDATILDLALGVGFNSKSSLNRVFKAQTGMTPSQYRDVHGSASPN